MFLGVVDDERLAKPDSLRPERCVLNEDVTVPPMHVFCEPQGLCFVALGVSCNRRMEGAGMYLAI